MASQDTKSTKRFSLKGNVEIENLLPRIERTFFKVGSTLGKYRIIEEIDRGGMAVVYKALQLDLDRVVALKVLPANITINRRFVDRFLSEAHAVAQLNHPNIVSIHEVAMEDNVYFLAMDYIPGKNLYYYLNLEKPKLVDVLEIVSTLADALGYAHRQKIVHRDLKLNNIIMRDDASPVLIDFGLAKALENEEGSITQTGEIMGSPAYMAPERLLGAAADHRSDICSLGIMLYEMLTFKNPYLDPRSIHQTTMNVLESDPIPPRKLVQWLPVEVEAITLKAMHKDQDKRYQTMEEMSDDVRRYQKGEPVLARPPSFISRGKHFFKKYWAWAVITTLIILFSTIIGISLYTQNRKERPHWQLVYSESFSTDKTDENWQSFTMGQSREKPIWVIRDGALHAPGNTSGFIRLEKPLTRDIKIEFDIAATEKSLFDVGFFLNGDSPDSGYTFHINRWGTPECGITFPSSKFLFRDFLLPDHPERCSYHVTVEKQNGQISFSINDKHIATIWDLFPPLGKSHQKIGFFSSGGTVLFDNLKVYRLAIPRLSSPTHVADRFWERGDLVTALEEYSMLLEDFPDFEQEPDVLLKISDCLIRMQRYTRAREFLNKTLNSKYSNQTHLAQAHYLFGTLYYHQNNFDEAMIRFRELHKRYPSHPGNQHAILLMAQRNASLIDNNRINEALANVDSLAWAYNDQTSLTGNLYLYAANHYLRAKMPGKALSVLTRAADRFSDNPILLSSIRLKRGMAYLMKGERKKANEAFNRSITPPIQTHDGWMGWMMLAQIYEYRFMYKDALKIYRKIYQECPRGTDLPWLAKLKTGELAPYTRQHKDFDLLFRSVIDAPSPYPLPRATAQFYLGELSENEFHEILEKLGYDSREIFRFTAQKELIEGNYRASRRNFKRFMRHLSRSSWEYHFTERILQNPILR
ncbi:MAG: protein kinase [Chitinivibrionales bacterium]|nr:protein kinase [Chitinivibrionales bacterium]